MQLKRKKFFDCCLLSLFFFIIGTSAIVRFNRKFEPIFSIIYFLVATLDFCRVGLVEHISCDRQPCCRVGEVDAEALRFIATNFGERPGQTPELLQVALFAGAKLMDLCSRKSKTWFICHGWLKMNSCFGFVLWIYSKSLGMVSFLFKVQLLFVVFGCLSLFFCFLRCPGGPTRLNEEELTELMRLAEPDPEGNVAVPIDFGAFWGHVIFVV